MGKERDSFMAAARMGALSEAFFYLNALNMSDMLRALHDLPPMTLADLVDKRAQFSAGVNMPRMEYAMFVVQTRSLPAGAPGDLEATGQVKDARNYLQTQGAAGTTSSAPGTGHKYTNSPNEVPTKTTTPTPRDVVTMLGQAWPQLTETGARTLTAQFMAETGGGRYCFNWNLGNVKAGPKELHMYLRGVWEVDSPAGAQAQVARANGLAHVATDQEIKKHGWSCPTGKAVAVFDPPHPQCRFRAYNSLLDGAQRWLGHHQRISQGDPGFLTALNAGNIAAVAHALKLAGYYTAGEADYARAMTRAKTDVDRALGAIK